jgi:hypothetical protein
MLEAAGPKDVEETLRKLPASHQKLVRGYKYVFQNGMTMKGDKKHVGLIDDGKRNITLAAPWSYTREFVLLHEIANLVWNKLLNLKQQDRWKEIAKSTKHKSESNPEELFCHAYAFHFSEDRAGNFHDHSHWSLFIKKL